MKFVEAAEALAARLADGNDDLAAGGAVQLMIEAWQYLGGFDPAWDRFGLEVLDVRSRMYSDEIVVDADAPEVDHPQLRLAVIDLVEQLARHHERHAVNQDHLARRLHHDATAQQLRRAAAVLA
ncbi:hypothetical protein ACIBSS_32715 [Micromonospora aurantiaca]|uniref:hypothetical protein n=1 Tax=Micromonospora aurantiaca (nom. illeg.) TaxID=47850 RepID=UPI000F3AEBB2|nr:hypothetical protein [Micromonospora aurantiaca]RNH98234.1 hypothetical protein EEZ25_27100 [Micromonospora aurantiaca]